MSTKESSARTMKAIKATVCQELNEIDFFHTNSQMVDARMRGDDVTHVSFSIGKAVFFLEGIGTNAQNCQAIRDIGQQLVTAADLLQAELKAAEPAAPAEQLLLGE
jgi:sorbitol-specific phosphotransferase system component IIA